MVGPVHGAISSVSLKICCQRSNGFISSTIRSSSSAVSSTDILDLARVFENDLVDKNIKAQKSRVGSTEAGKSYQFVRASSSNATSFYSRVIMPIFKNRSVDQF